MVLTDLSKLLAPFMPFTADSIFKNLTGKESVHLENWPKTNEEYIQTELNFENQLIRQIVTLGHAVRDKANIKVRQPLSLVQIGLPANVDPKIILAQKEVITEELNVKDLKILSDVGEFVARVAIPNAKILGPKYGKAVQEIIQLAKSGKFEVLDNGMIKVGEYTLGPLEVEVGYQGKAGFDVASGNGISVILDTTVTAALKQEGQAREIVRFIQDLRKEAQYQVSDRIYIFVESKPEFASTLEAHADYIRKETLAIELQDKGDFQWDLEKSVEIDGVEMKIAVRR